MWWKSSPPNESYPLGCPIGLPHPPPAAGAGLRPRPPPRLAFSGHLATVNSANPDQLVDNLLLHRSAVGPRTRILIADAHPIVRIGINTLLSSESDLEVVGEVARGDEVESAVDRLAPNLLISEVNLPEMDAVNTTRRLATRYPEMPILILTICDDEELILGLLEAGVTGYALKEEPPTNLLLAVRAVAGGQTWLSGRVTRMLVRKAVAACGPLVLPQSPSPLTERELEVLALIGRGLSNPQIAEALCISVGTVRSHLNHIYDKTDLRGRSQAMRYAVAHGLVRTPSDEQEGI
jgi:DNA-binding NarL/FixJ family response regulator